MENNNSPTSTLEGISLRIQSLRVEMGALSEKFQDKKTTQKKEDENFKAELERLKAEVRNKNLSVGDVTKDYVLVNYPFYMCESFLDEFTKHTESLNSLLGKLSNARCFWHHKNESNFFVKEGDIYEILFLGEKPYVITPAEIRLQSQSSRIITLESVFLDKKVRWPFVKDIREEKELVVAPRESSSDFKAPKIANESCDINNLEKVLKNNPLALVVFRKALELEVAPDLQEKANQYIHEIAFKAFNGIKENYLDVKSNDKTIQQIEEEYDSPQKVSGMFATRPVIPDPEPDPVLARILSSNARGNREISLKRLAVCINDLDRTGLANYDMPLEQKIGAGQTIISNLAEYSQYVRGILELGFKAMEKATA